MSEPRLTKPITHSLQAFCRNCNWQMSMRLNAESTIREAARWHAKIEKHEIEMTRTTTRRYVP